MKVARTWNLHFKDGALLGVGEVPTKGLAVGGTEFRLFQQTFIELDYWSSQYYNHVSLHLGEIHFPKKSDSGDLGIHPKHFLFPLSTTNLSRSSDNLFFFSSCVTE